MALVRECVGAEILGSEQILTGLAIVASRLDTDSVRVFYNNPRAPYYDPAHRAPGAVPDRDLPLANLTCAGTAAPTGCSPERIEIASGASPFVDPALSMLMRPSGGLRISLVAGRRPATHACGVDRIDISR